MLITAAIATCHGNVANRRCQSYLLPSVKQHSLMIVSTSLSSSMYFIFFNQLKVGSVALLATYLLNVIRHSCSNRWCRQKKKSEMKDIFFDLK